MSGIQSGLHPAANRLLALLPSDEFQRLFPLLQSFPLQTKRILYNARGPLDYVYFPMSGFVSAMTIMEDGSAIEVATIGNEGVVGLTAFIGGETSPYDVMVQGEGLAWRMRADAFRQEVARDGQLRRILVLYNTAFCVQTAYSVACNGLHTAEKRCCRWLLMTQDRVGSNRLELTHEFLSIMLGVRRASVTETLQPLQKRGLINNARGIIEILDRTGIEALACECYRAITQEYERLFA